jgi:hypothetical protein
MKNMPLGKEGFAEFLSQTSLTAQSLLAPAQVVNTPAMR